MCIYIYISRSYMSKSLPHQILNFVGLNAHFRSANNPAAHSMPAAKVFIGKQVVPKQPRSSSSLSIAIHYDIVLHCITLRYVAIHRAMHYMLHWITYKSPQKLLRAKKTGHSKNPRSPELLGLKWKPLRAESVLYTSEEHIEPTWLRHWDEGRWVPEWSLGTT